MKIKDYIPFLKHIQDKPENYVERFMVAYVNKISDLKDMHIVDSYSKEKWNTDLQKANSLFGCKMENKVSQFKHLGKEYQVLDEIDITVEHWIRYENANHKTDNIFDLYIPIISIMIGEDDIEILKEIDHSIAMPILDFFLSTLKKYENPTRTFILQQMNLINQTKNPEMSPILNGKLTEYFQEFINYWSFIPIQILSECLIPKNYQLKNS